LPQAFSIAMIDTAMSVGGIVTRRRVLDPLVLAFDIVGLEHGRGLVLFEDRLLIRLGGRAVVQFQLQFGAVRFADGAA
jgi:hypothetical protein